MKIDKELGNKVLQIYFRKSYSMGPQYKITQDELDFIEKNQFYVVVTEKTKNNGYQGDKDQVAEMLEVNKPYELKSMDVGRSSSTIELVDFPYKNFNSVNFEFLALDYDFIKEDYNKILSQIESLNIEKQRLEKLMFERTDDFISKFRIWYNNDDDCHSDWIPNEHDCPLLRKLIDKYDYRRGETVDLERLLGDEDFYDLVDPYQDDDYRSEEEYNENLSLLLIKYQPLLEEIMNKEIKSYKNDW